MLLHILLLTGLFFTLKNRKKPQESTMVATLVSPEELKPLPRIKPVLPKIIRPKTKTEKFKNRRLTRMMRLPRPTPEELKNMPLHGMTKGHLAPNVRKTAKTEPSFKKTGPRSAISSIKGNGGKTPLAKKETPVTKGPGYSGSPAIGSGRKPGTRLVKPLLFDPGVIGEVARNYDTKREKEHSAKPSAITFDTSDAKYIGYMERLKEIIESIWKYPRRAADQGLQGDLEISFTIKKDGELAHVEVVRTSGYPILDEAAVQALKDAHYWPLPDAWHQDSFTVDGHFLYSLSGGPSVW